MFNDKFFEAMAFVKEAITHTSNYVSITRDIIESFINDAANIYATDYDEYVAIYEFLTSKHWPKYN